jgi:phage-related baseplate assembly protein
MSLLERQLPEPNFVSRDAETITREMIAQYESLTGKTLYPAQVERILIDVIAYRESLVRQSIQDAGKLNLVRYSRAPVLDYLGENVGVPRLQAIAASTTLRFVFDPTPAAPSVLAAGVMVEIGDVAFATTADVLVGAGVASIDVHATCTQVGVIGNGFVAGQIKALASVLPALSVASVANTRTSEGGAEAEDDEYYRERIVLAPEQWSNAGSVGAYRFWARSAHPDVIDVAVVSPSPGVVHIHPLSRLGLPTQSIKDLVYAKCSADTVRPLTDEVVVLDPVVVDYELVARITRLKDADSTLTLSEAQSAAQAWSDASRLKLGGDIVRTQINRRLHGYGVYSLDLQQPAADLVVGPQGWARCTLIDIAISGVAGD